MKRLLVALVVLTFIQISYGQNLNKPFIDKSLSLGKNVKYVINGLVYEQEDSIKLNSILHPFSESDIVDITILKSTSDVIFCRNYDDIVLIRLVYQLKNKQIKDKLKEIKKLFVKMDYNNRNSTTTKIPMLYIDNQLIPNNEIKNKLKELKSKNICYIDIQKESKDDKNYGDNAKNGLVRIWIRKK